MYLDIRFYLRCLAIFRSVRKQPLEVFCGSWSSCGFCRIHGRALVLGSLRQVFFLLVLHGGAFSTEQLWTTASVCSSYNLKSFIYVILQIHKLRQNILLNVICIKIKQKKCFRFILLILRYQNLLKRSCL